MPGLTSSDILKINNSEEIVGIIDEVIKENPEMGYFSASPVTKNSYKTLAVNSLPSVAFREPGSNRSWSAITLNTKDVACKYLDASWILDQALASQSDWGKEVAIALCQKQHLKSAMFHLSKQIWYGTLSDAGGFNGLAGIVDAVLDSGGNKEMVLDANPGNTLSDASSVFFTTTGLESIQLAWGSDGRLDEGDILPTLIGDATSGAWHWAQKLGGWVGLQVTSRNAAVRLTNLSATSGKNGLSDNLIYQALERFPAGLSPTAMFMTRRSREQLRASRTATNATGSPAPTPNDVAGIPIYTTDALSNAETYTTGSSDSTGSGS